MYWLKWHYHVKNIAEPPYKIKQVRQKRWQSVVAGRQPMKPTEQSAHLLLRLINAFTYLLTYWWISCWWISMALLWKTRAKKVVIKILKWKLTTLGLQYYTADLKKRQCTVPKINICHIYLVTPNYVVLCGKCNLACKYFGRSIHELKNAASLKVVIGHSKLHGWVGRV